MCDLIQKYNVPGPRYTSYPPVPFWDTDAFRGSRYKEGLTSSFREGNQQDSISLYIHLPFCERLCTFCGCHKRITRRHEVEVPYIRAVLREWELYRNLLGERPRITALHLGGGTPTFFSPENLHMLVEGLLRGAVAIEGTEWGFEGHPNNTTRDHLQVLYDLGFRRVSYGVQDYNDKVQHAIHRVQPFENVRKVTEWARQIGYSSVGHDLIYGLPHQEAIHIRETIKKTLALGPDRVAFYSYAHVPWLKGNGQRGFRDADLPTAEEKQNQYEIGSSGLLRAGYREIGMDHFALPSDPLGEALDTGSLHRNFMGYSVAKTRLLIGLGASAISDSGYGYAQNVKQVEEYQDLVSQGIIPIYRGHLLTSEDRLVRQHILNLMCRFRTNWGDFGSGTFLRESVMPQLEELIKDGLVLAGPDTLEITKKGRPFVRNVCMAFDTYLGRNSPEKRLFSMTV